MTPPPHASCCPRSHTQAIQKWPGRSPFTSRDCEPPSSVIEKPRDVFLPVDVQDALLVLPDVDPPRRSEEMGGWTLRFFTQFLAYDPDGQTKTHLRRWEVRWDASGQRFLVLLPRLAAGPHCRA